MCTMKYRKKPIVIEAFQMTAEHMAEEAHRERWPNWLKDQWNKRVIDHPTVPHMLIIHTVNGTRLCSENDWITRGIQGELYPYKPDIFKQTYEAVE